MSALITILIATVAGVLVFLGIGGTAYHMFRDGGLLAQGVDKLWEAHYQAPVITVLTTVLIIYVARAIYIAKIGSKRDSIVPDLVLYAFIGIGIYFVGRLMFLGQI